MIAALATIAFLAAAWAAIVILSSSLDQKLGRIASALRGEADAPAHLPVALRVSQRYPSGRAQRARARPSLRAAA